MPLPDLGTCADFDLIQHYTVDAKPETPMRLDSHLPGTRDSAMYTLTSDEGSLCSQFEEHLKSTHGYVAC